MMALEDVGGSMLKTRLPHSRHRKTSVDLADAAVPTGTSVPLSRNSGTLFLLSRRLLGTRSIEHCPGGARATILLGQLKAAKREAQDVGAQSVKLKRAYTARHLGLARGLAVEDVPADLGAALECLAPGRLQVVGVVPHPTPLSVLPLLRPWRHAWPGYPNARAGIHPFALG